MNRLSVRKRAFALQKGVCPYCDGRFQNPRNGTIDHIIPRSWRVRVSRNAPSGTNLALAHKRCNARKSIVEGYLKDPHNRIFPVEVEPRPRDYYNEMVRRFREGEAPFSTNKCGARISLFRSTRYVEVMGQTLENLRRLSETDPEIFI